MVNLRRIKQANSSDLKNVNPGDRIYLRNVTFNANRPSSYIAYDFIVAEFNPDGDQLVLQAEDLEDGEIQTWYATHVKENESIILTQVAQDGKETNYAFYVKKPIRSSSRRHRSSGGKRTRRR